MDFNIIIKFQKFANAKMQKFDFFPKKYRK